MVREIHKREGLLDIFSEIHRSQVGDKLRLEITFAVDPTIERLAAAFYMDGSDSMRQAGNYGRGGGLFFLGRRFNPVEAAMRVAVPYVAGKDANGKCRVAYWATGPEGRDVEVIGELTAEEAASYDFRGPKRFGGATYLLAAVRDFVAYIQQLQAGGETIEAALVVVVTDGQFHDFDDVMDYTQELARAIMAGKFPRANFTVVGVGPAVDPEQMEALMHRATPPEYTGREIWCYALADHIGDLPELVSHLVDENTPAFWGGATVTDDAGKTLLTFEDMAPAVIEFEIPATAKSFTLTTGGKSYTQPLASIPAGHGGHDEEEEAAEEGHRPRRHGDH